MKVLILDLGLWDGREIQEYLNIFDQLNISDVNYKIIGFEAYPPFADYCQKRYAEYSSVEIETLAVSATSKPVRLYKNGGGGPGNSLFEDKNNVNKDDYVEVMSTNIIDYLQKRDLVKDYQIKILRMNVEGSEYEIIRDLVKRGLHEMFDLYIGSRPGVDLLKVKSLERRYKPYLKLLELMGISFHHFTCDSDLPNYDLASFLKDKLSLL